MTLVKQEITLLLSSNPEDGASQVSDDGSTFTVSLRQPIQLPRNCVDVNVYADTATIWYNTANIKTGINDTFYLFDNGNSYITPIPEGLYDLTGLNQAINRALVNAGADNNLITLVADNNTQKVIIQFNKAGLQVGFNDSDTFREILGFNARSSPAGGPTTTNLEYDTGDNIARFNQLEYYLIHTSLSNSGFYIGSASTDTLAQVLIDQPVGSQLLYNPFKPNRLQANDLMNFPINEVRCRLTDQNDNNVDTRGEYWSVKIVIEYEIYVS